MLFASLVSEQGGVSADRVRKDLIQLAGNAQLVLLKLRETADHERVFEVRGNHCLQKLHVVGAELAEAFVHHAAELAIALTAIFNDRFDVFVALVQVLDDFFKVAAENVLIGEELLFGEKLANLCLLGLVALADDSHGIVMLLPVEDHIKASLVEFGH